MPSSVKKASIALMISLISTVIAAYLGEIYLDENGAMDSVFIGIDFIWALIIAWLIWDLYKKKDIKVTLVLVSIIMLVSVIWGVSWHGLDLSQLFYLFELLMFVTAFFLLRTKESNEWFSKNDL